MTVVGRYFTVDEANATLEEVRPLVEQLVGYARTLAVAQARWAELSGTMAGNGGGFPPSELADAAEAVDRARADVARTVNAIHALGAVVKDLETGLIDFPALHRGQEVLLCWQLGEDEVAYWHDLESGFAGRRSLPFD